MLFKKYYVIERGTRMKMIVDPSNRPNRHYHDNTEKVSQTVQIKKRMPATSILFFFRVLPLAFLWLHQCRSETLFCHSHGHNKFFHTWWNLTVKYTFYPSCSEKYWIIYRKMIISLIIVVFLCLYSNKKRLCRFFAEAASIFATRN